MAGLQSRLAIFFCILLIGAGIGIGVGASTPDGPASVETGSQSVEPMEHDTASENRTTVMVRLEPVKPARLENRSRTARIETLQKHAETTQQRVKRFAANSSRVTIEQSFWVTNAVAVSVETDNVSTAVLERLEYVTAVHPDFAVSVADTTTLPGVSNTPAETVGAEGVPTTGTPEAPRPKTETEDSANWTFEPTSVAVQSRGYSDSLRQTEVPATWRAFGNQGSGVRVAVLDTGIDTSHPDLSLTSSNGWAEFNETGHQINSQPYDSGTHGTLVSGIIAGGSESGTAVGVAPDVELMHAKVLDDGSGTFSSVLAGIEWAIVNDAAVINMSLGGSSTNNREEMFIEPLQQAEAAGVLVVTASGNYGPGESSSPGDIYDGFSIGAVEADDTVAGFSSGETVLREEFDSPPSDWPAEWVVPDAVAPGVGVLSTIPDGQYARADGTSMATPHVSGTAALALANADDPLSPAETQGILTTTATDTGASEDRQGSGRIDSLAAVDAVTARTIQPASFDVEIDSIETSVTEGDSVTVTATVTNTGDPEATQNISLNVDTDLDGTFETTVATTTRTLLGGESTTVTGTYQTTTGDASGIAVEIRSSDTRAARTVDVIEPVPQPANLTLTLDTETLAIGETATPTVTATRNNTTQDVTSNATITTDDPGIVKINATTSALTGISSGNTSVTATYLNKSSTVSITVINRTTDLYRDSEGRVSTGSLLDGIHDWRRGLITTGLLLEIIHEWRDSRQ